MSAPWDTAPRTPAAGRKRHTDNPDPGLGALLARVVEWNKLVNEPLTGRH